MSLATRVGIVLLAVRPLYYLSEVVAAAGFAGPYSFVDDTVSALGVAGCPVSASVAPGCSPRHALVNGSFVGYGVLLAVGAVLLAGRWSTRWGRAAVVLLVVSGLSSVATGAAPLDRGAGVHLAAALPVFVAQPLALLLLGVELRARRPRVAGFVLACGVVSALGAFGFGLLLDAVHGGGLVERVALWPVFVAVATAAAAEVIGPTARPLNQAP